jgi:hypothetical protein
MTRQINLFNPALAPRRDWLSSRMLGLYLLGYVALLGVAYAALSVSTQALRDRHAQTLTQRDASRARLVALARAMPPQAPSDLLRGEHERLAASLTRFEQTANLIKSGKLGATQGFAEYLRAFARQSGGDVWLTGFTLRHPDAIEIAGGATRADAVPEFIQRLAREPLFKGRGMSALDMTRPEPQAAGPAQADAKAAVVAPAPPHITFRIGSAARKS